MHELTQAFERDRTYLWGLAYRMTGSAADADDVVQDAFERSITRPPRDLEASLRPWLVRVAVNLARDCLRRRYRVDVTADGEIVALDVVMASAKLPIS